MRILRANSPFHDADVVAAYYYDKILARCGSADGASDGRAHERLAARLPRLRICWDLRDDIHEAVVPEAGLSRDHLRVEVASVASS